MSEHKICKHLTVHNLAPGMNQVYCGDCEYSYSVLVEVELCSCPHDPNVNKGKAMGMYHCPECGAMVLAGMNHPSDDDVRFTGIPAYGDDDEACISNNDL